MTNGDQPSISPAGKVRAQTGLGRLLQPGLRIAKCGGPLMGRVALIGLIVAGSVFARDYDATVVRVIDGDTLVCDVELGFGVVLDDQAVRMANVNAPELGTPEGETAKREAELIFTAGRKVRLSTGRREREKYGRILATVTLLDPTPKTK